VALGGEKVGFQESTNGEGEGVNETGEDRLQKRPLFSRGGWDIGDGASVGTAAFGSESADRGAKRGWQHFYWKRARG